MRLVYRGIVAILLLSLIWIPVAADYQSGVKAYSNGDFEQALADWQRVIESPADDVHPYERAETFYAVAMLFWLGQGVPQDTSTSAGFLRQAAELNHAGAQSKLGYLFLIGQGVPASTFEAMKWLDMAARQGDADAQYNLAVMYRDGIGVDADQQLALQWFKEAAANGDPVSAEVVAQFEGSGVLQGQTASSLTEVPTEQTNTPEQAMVNAEDPDSQVSPDDIVEDPPAQVVDASSESGISRSFDENWIMQRDPEHYTIQVMALKNLESMNRLMEAHPQLEPLAIYFQGEPDAPLYVLLQGDYADIEAVRAAQQGFPKSLAKPSQLWVRRFGMVQGLIESRQQAIRASDGDSRVTD